MRFLVAILTVVLLVKHDKAPKYLPKPLLHMVV